MDLPPGPAVAPVEARGDVIHCAVTDGPLSSVEAMLDRIVEIEQERRRHGGTHVLRVLDDIRGVQKVAAGVPALAVRGKAEFEGRVMAVAGAPGPGGAIVSIPPPRRESRGPATSRPSARPSPGSGRADAARGARRAAGNLFLPPTLVEPVDPPRTVRMLVDRHGRHVSDLRVSLTDRCNFSCAYCHNEGLGDTRGPAAPAAGEMTRGHVARILRVAREFDVTRVKFTGGEPLLRRDLEDVVRDAAALMEVSLTTNGSLLATRAQALKDAGLSRINVSIDTLDPRHFRAVRRGSLEPVLSGLEAALAAGLAPVKINAVLLDATLGELPELVDFVAARPGLHLQLIEVMPEIRTDMLERRVDLARVRAWLEARAARVEQRSMHHRRVYHLDGGATVELVDPVGNAEFCANCHRLRVTHEGHLKGCLNRLDDHVPTAGLDDEGLRDAFRRVVASRVPYYGVLHRGGVHAADDPKRLYASLRRPLVR